MQTKLIDWIISDFHGKTTQQNIKSNAKYTPWNDTKMEFLVAYYLCTVQIISSYKNMNTNKNRI